MVATRTVPGRGARRVLRQRVALVVAGGQDVPVDRVDDLHRPHLVDGVVDHHDDHAERDRRQDEGEARAEDRPVDRADGHEREQHVDRQADEEAEVELVRAAHQELVGDLGRQRGGALLQGDEQQREGDRRDRDDGGRDGGEEAGERGPIAHQLAEPREARRNGALRPGPVRIVGHEREHDEAEHHGRRQAEELPQRPPQRGQDPRLQGGRRNDRACCHGSRRAGPPPCRWSQRPVPGSVQRLKKAPAASRDAFLRRASSSSRSISACSSATRSTSSCSDRVDRSCPIACATLLAGLQAELVVAHGVAPRSRLDCAETPSCLYEGELPSQSNDDALRSRRGRGRTGPSARSTAPD